MEPNDIAILLNSQVDNFINIKPGTLGKSPKGLSTSKPAENSVKPVKREGLTTKTALKYLVEGKLKKKVCRYCLDVAQPLSELDQVLEIGGTGVMYKITIRDMVASFHPFKVSDDPNFPNKICNKCLNRTISSYLFTQQCERSERALRNCFEDMYNKVEKLDPLEPKQKKRGRQKLHPNYNVLYTEHKKVIDYAEPIINIVNLGSSLMDQDDNEQTDNVNQLECLKCFQVLPNAISLANHEKLHPKTMYYHCRYCGKSFTKRNLLKRHRKTAHENGKEAQFEQTDFKCRECDVINKDYNKHLQHIEKHKFQMVMEHLIEKNMDRLCAVCFDNKGPLVHMDKIICLHGGYPEMMGNRTLYNILGSTIPDMNILHNYTGTKICEKCLNHAITAYVFIHQTQYIRNRLNACISLMLDSLNNLNTTQDTNPKVVVEISQDTIMPVKDQELDEGLLFDEQANESELTVEVLEDEFRLNSESEESANESRDPNDEKTESSKYEENSQSSFELEEDKKNVFIKHSLNYSIFNEDSFDSDNPAKHIVKTYNKKKINGFQSNSDKSCNSLNICSEFLTFKKKKKPVNKFYTCKFTCPTCSKHFASDYFLRRHIMKHANKRIECKLCRSSFQSKFYLYEHVKMIHILHKSSCMTCGECGRIFDDPSKLDRHSQTHMTKECELCDKKFASQKHHDNHMQRHIVKLKLLRQRQVQTCSFCEKECSNDNQLSVHVNKVHLQIKPYSCDMCERQFYTESNMNSHKKMHNLFSKESCEFCGKSLKCRRDLVVHVRKHIGVQPHSCPICDLRFYSSGKVKMHMSKTHGGAFCCKLCKFILKSKSELRHHINRTHNII